jgi:motility quorum-sensing regulator/GCU-specific mRNA interferase toxin
MSIKGRPHHSLEGIQTKFGSVGELEITGTATRNARGLGLSLQDVVDAIQQLRGSDFRKSETAHNPVNHKIWHDTYITRYRDLRIYLKFAGETLIDVTLTSFKEHEK